MTKKSNPAFESIRKALLNRATMRAGKRSARVFTKCASKRLTSRRSAPRTGLSQRAFAKSIGVAVGTLQGWEQGRRRPDGPARVLLALIDKRPRIVQEELAA